MRSLRVVLFLVIQTAVLDAQPPVEGPAIPQDQPDRLPSGIIIGKDTTRLDGPIRDGVIDYLEALNQRLSKGATEANNAAVPLWRAVGAESPFLEGVDVADLFRRLDTKPPTQGPFWQPFEQFLETQFPNFDRQQRNQAQDSLQESMTEPWRPASHPVVAAWLDANRIPLDQIVAGVQRSHWYQPMVRNLDSEGQTLIVAAFSSIEIPREVARALASRAMRSTASGEFDAAWNDILACHRLSRHLASANATLIEMLVAIAIDGVACQAEWKFVQQAPPLDVIQRMAKQRKTLGSLPVTADVLDEGERFIFLDAVMNLASGRGASDVFGDDAWVRRLLSLSIDWNETLRIGNSNYDRIVAMSKLTTHAERIAANDKFTEDLKEMMKRPSALALAAMMLSGSADKLVGKQLGKVLIALLLPAVHQARNAEERAKSMDELTDVVIALAAHKAKHGAYPERLSGLHEKPPMDRFSGKALIYRREGDGYWLYNVGPNLRDDAGKGPYTDGDYPEEDDNAVRSIR